MISSNMIDLGVLRNAEHSPNRSSFQFPSLKTHLGREEATERLEISQEGKSDGKQERGGRGWRMKRNGVTEVQLDGKGIKRRKGRNTDVEKV